VKVVILKPDPAVDVENVRPPPPPLAVMAPGCMLAAEILVGISYLFVGYVEIGSKSVTRFWKIFRHPTVLD
jgi:hypothetical protein